jgi:16S rRNA processing protein RimM
MELVFVGKSPETSSAFDVEAVEPRETHMVVKFVQVPDRTAAEPLVGSYLYVDEKDVEPPGKGEYFIHEVVGCRMFSETDEFVGVVEAVYSMPGHDLWEVKNGDRVHMIPAVKAFIKSVDIAGRKIVIHVLEGLLD